MSREPVKQKGLATVSCIDGRWFQAKTGNPAVPASRVPLPVPEWEVRNALAVLAVAAASLDSTPWLARQLRLQRFRQAREAYHNAVWRFTEIADLSDGHRKAAERLQSGFQLELKGKVQP